MSVSESVNQASPSPSDLTEFEQRLQALRGRLDDLKEIERLDTIPPDQWADMQDQLLGLETRMKEYLSELRDVPALFWQVVRWSGLGLLIGVAVQRWLLGG